MQAFWYIGIKLICQRAKHVHLFCFNDWLQQALIYVFIYLSIYLYIYMICIIY